MTFKSGEFAGVRHVTVDNFGGGSIAVEPGAQAGVVESTINAADDQFLDEVQVQHSDDQLRITFPPVFWRSQPAHLRLGVPEGLTFQIRAGSADIAISAAIGRSKIVNGSGDVQITSAEDLDCSTGSGDIVITSLAGNAAKVSSGSGSISITTAHCPVSAKSGSGDVVVRSLHRSDLKASSGSGDIAVPSTTGSVDLRSASGSLTIGVADNVAAWLDLNSISGDIRIALESTGKPGPGEPYVSLRARTASGDIAVYRA